MTKLALASLCTVALAACGSPALDCQTQPCSGAAKTYQLCVNLDASETWKFGGMSCHASSTDTSGVEKCTSEVSTYCGGGPIPGLDGGVDGGSHACTYTISGAQTSSGTCMADAAYSSSNNGVAFVVTTTTPALNFAATLMLQTLTTGSYDDASAMPGYGAEWLASLNGAYDMCSTSSNCSTATGQTSTPQGSFELTISSAGPVTSAGGAMLWQAPQGTLSIVMPAQPDGPETGTVTANVTF